MCTFNNTNHVDSTLHMKTLVYFLHSTYNQNRMKIISGAEKKGACGDTTSRRDLGLEHTFSANGFATYWLQSISLSYARSQAESIMVWVGCNAPASSAHDTDNTLH